MTKIYRLLRLIIIVIKNRYFNNWTNIQGTNSYSKASNTTRTTSHKAWTTPAEKIIVAGNVNSDALLNILAKRDPICLTSTVCLPGGVIRPCTVTLMNELPPESVLHKHCVLQTNVKLKGLKFYE